MCEEKVAEKAVANEEKQQVQEGKVAEEETLTVRNSQHVKQKQEKATAGGGHGQAQGACHRHGCGCGGAAVGKISDDQDGSASDLDLDSDTTHHSNSGTPPPPSSPSSCIGSLNKDPTHPQLNVIQPECRGGSSIVAEGTLIRTSVVIQELSTEVVGSPAPVAMLEPQAAHCRCTLHHGTCQH